jgi:O-antigen/teichoic acid export membrane protein
MAIFFRREQSGIGVRQLLRLLAGAIDGLSYPLALVCAGPVIVRLSGSVDYSRLAFVVLLASVGSLFNIVGVQGVIYSLARTGVRPERRYGILSALCLLVLAGTAVFAVLLPVITQISGAARIFPPAEIRLAEVMGWALCLLISFDGVSGGVLKARHLVELSAPVEFLKLVGIVAGISLVAGRGRWQWDCYCVIAAAAGSLIVKSVVIAFATDIRPSGLRTAMKELGEVARINSWQWLLVLAAFLFQQADRLIIASRLGAAKFAMYNFYWQATFVIHAASAAGLIWILPIATAKASAADGNISEAYRRDVILGAGVATTLVAVVLAFGLIAFHSHLVPVQLKEEWRAFLIMIFAAYLAALSVIPYYYMMALGYLATVAMVTVATAALAFCTALWAVRSHGITGLALSKLWSGGPLLCYWLCYAEIKRLGERHRKAEESSLK